MDRKKEKFNINKHIIILLLLFVPNVAFFLLIRLSSSFPTWYNKNIFRVISSGFGGGTSFVPFSIVEIILYIFVLWFLYTIIVDIVKVIYKKERVLPLLKPRIFWILEMGLILLLVYNLACGVNYHIPGFAAQNNIVSQDYSVEALEKLCNDMTLELLKLEDKVQRDEEGIMRLSIDADERAKVALARLSLDFEGLDMMALQPKAFIFSPIMSYLQISGFYSPFTVEANYNKDMVDYNIPFTMIHELAHTMGYMKEDEANFIAYLACVNSNDVELKYSGTLLGWIYATNLLNQHDTDAYTSVRSRLTKGIEADLAANSIFWDKYDGTIAEIQERVNDTYLKMNQQADGIKSYGRMVDLIYAYRMKEGK